MTAIDFVNGLSLVALIVLVLEILHGEVNR
jgi:hypothetical protein